MILNICQKRKLDSLGHYCQSLVENLVTNSGPGPAFVTKVLNKTLTSETLYCSTHLCHIFYLKSNFNFLSKLHFGKFCSIYQSVPICICVCIPLTIYFNGIHPIFEICKLVQYYYIALCVYIYTSLTKEFNC